MSFLIRLKLMFVNQNALAAIEFIEYKKLIHLINAYIGNQIRAFAGNHIKIPDAKKEAYFKRYK
jgi:hypothetical protein